MDDGRFCVECFQTKWGVNPIEYLPLPSCLTNIVEGYLWFTNKEYDRNWQLMYLISRTCSSNTVVNVIKDSNTLNDTKVMYFIADRYCRSEKVWEQLTRWSCNPYETMLFSSLDIARVFEPYHPIDLTRSLLQKILEQQKNDEMFWWIINLKHIHWPPIDEFMFDFIFSTILRWQSKRVLRHFIDIGSFASAQMACICLQIAVTVEHGWPVFLDVWNIHFSDVFLFEHGMMLRTALETCNIPVLDFLSTLKKSTIEPCEFDFLAHRVNFIQKVRAWLIRNQHMVNGEFAFVSNLNYACMVELFDAGMFATHTLTNIILERDDVNNFIPMTCRSRENPGILLTMLSRMTHLGTKQQICETARLMCNHLSLRDFVSVLSMPVVRQHVTFAVLRNARSDFLYRLFSFQHSSNPTCVEVSTLDWIASWRDIEQQTLSMKDVDANKNALMRFAEHTRNTKIQTWIANFKEHKK